MSSLLWIHIPLFREAFQFYLSCNHAWPTACSQFLLTWSQVHLPKLQFWSSFLHHPDCLPMSHIPTLFKSSYPFTSYLASFTTALISKHSTAPSLFLISATLLQKEPLLSLIWINCFFLLHSVSPSIFSSARILFLKFLSHLFNILT